MKAMKRNSRVGRAHGSTLLPTRKFTKALESRQVNLLSKQTPTYSTVQLLLQSGVLQRVPSQHREVIMLILPPPPLPLLLPVQSSLRVTAACPLAGYLQPMCLLCMFRSSFLFVYDDLVTDALCYPAILRRPCDEQIEMSV